MLTAGQILRTKATDVVSVRSDSTVLDAIKKMATNDIGSVAVVDDGKLVGIFTERHYTRKVFLRGRTSPSTQVGEVMAQKPVCVSPDATVEECMAIMQQRRFRHLPVIENNALQGIVSVGDLMSHLLSDKTFQIDQLERYVRGE